MRNRIPLDERISYRYHGATRVCLRLQPAPSRPSRLRRLARTILRSFL